MTPASPEHGTAARGLINRRHDPGRYQRIDRNDTAGHIPTRNDGGTPVNRPHDPHPTKGKP
ncbi:hypothetical protein ACIBMZ_20570 [Micromonospora sp. NPDC049900]|uniref:hypothetical protein n=1 Tax=Micromonospora sp. NPDC049900 TaxID=3364275 RepID=UPI00378E8A22